MIFDKFKRNKVFNLNRYNLSGHIDSWNGETIHGWFVSNDNKKLVKLYFDEQEKKIIERNYFREDLVKSGICDHGQSGFIHSLDLNEIRSKSIKYISISVDRKHHLIGSPIEIKDLKQKGFIDKVDDVSLSGWIYDESYPSAKLKLDVFINSEKIKTIIANQPRKDLLDAGIPIGNCGFYIDLSAYIHQSNINTLDIKFYSTEILAFPSQIIQSKSAKISALSKLQNLIKKEVFKHKDDDFFWLNHNVIPYLLDSIRQGNDSLLKATRLNEYDSIYYGTDIIIPVYKGISETINCIKSVFSVEVDTKFNVIVINDCSPEEKLTDALRKLKKELPFTLLENKTNLGFVQTVNKGMSISANNDVLLLNSDTIVTDHWIDRIVDTAYSDSSIGTVTPFSNNATICSYPKFCADNELPNQVSLKELAEIVGQNIGIIDLPTAHGFSMFIKRQTLIEVGLFDNQKWGKGYGEENDFSLRAARLGWRNVMATNAFVQHLGSVSFAEDSSAFIAKNLQILNGLYPDYSHNVQDFIKADPIRIYRNKIALALMKKEVNTQSKLAENYNGSYVFVSLTIGGGTEVATNDLSAIHLKNHQCVFMLVCVKPGVWELKSQVDNSVAQFYLPEEKEELLDALKSLDVIKFHIHHTLQFDKSIWDLPKSLGVNYDVTLHDYYAICPRVNLIDETEFYCGEPNIAACNRCIKKNGVHDSSYLKFYDFDNDIVNWRDFFQDKLKKAEKVITPSFDTKERILKHFNLSNVEAIYHPEPEFIYKPKSLEKIEIINIAFIGAIGVHKGLNVLKECAEYAYKFDLPVKFTVIGYTSDDTYFNSLPNVTITGKYNRFELPEIINKHDIHIAGLLSVWPETYSYTLSEAMRQDLKIMCFNFGAISERMRNFNAQPLIFNNPRQMFEALKNGCDSNRLN